MADSVELPHLTSNSIQEILGQMLKNLQCPICLELLTNPVSTNCNHRFCSFCVTSFFKTQRVLPCPLCNTSVTKRSIHQQHLLSNVIQSVRQLIEAFEADTRTKFSPLKNASTFFPSTPEALVTKRKSNSKRKYPVESSCRTLRSQSHSAERVKPQESTSGSHFRTKSSQSTTARKKISFPSQSVQPNDSSTLTVDNNNSDILTVTGLCEADDGQSPTFSSPVKRKSSKCDSKCGSTTEISSSDLKDVILKDTACDVDFDSTEMEIDSNSHVELLQYLRDGSCGAVNRSYSSDQANGVPEKQCDEKERQESRLSVSKGEGTTVSQARRIREKKKDSASNQNDICDCCHEYPLRRTPGRRISNDANEGEVRAESQNSFAMQPVTRTYSKGMKHAFKMEKSRAKFGSKHEFDQTDPFSFASECEENLLGQASEQVDVCMFEDENEKEQTVQVSSLSVPNIKRMEDCSENPKDDDNLDDFVNEKDNDHGTPPAAQPTSSARRRIFRNKTSNSTPTQEKPILKLSQDPFEFKGETPVKEKQTVVKESRGKNIKKGKSRKDKAPLSFQVPNQPSDKQGAGSVCDGQQQLHSEYVSLKKCVKFKREQKGLEEGKLRANETIDSTAKEKDVDGISQLPDKLQPREEKDMAKDYDNKESNGVAMNRQSELFPGDDSFDPSIQTFVQGEADAEKPVKPGKKRVSKRKSPQGTASESMDEMIKVKELKKMQSKITEAETYDLMFSTQEARQYIQEQEDKATCSTQENKMGIDETISRDEVISPKEKQPEFLPPEIVPSHAVTTENIMAEYDSTATCKLKQNSDLDRKTIERQSEISQKEEQYIPETKQGDDDVSDSKRQIPSECDFRFGRKTNQSAVHSKQSDGAPVAVKSVKIKPVLSRPNLASMMRYNPLSVKSLPESPEISGKTFSVICETPLMSGIVLNSYRNGRDSGHEIVVETLPCPSQGTTHEKQTSTDLNSPSKTPIVRNGDVANEFHAQDSENLTVGAKTPENEAVAPSLTLNASQPIFSDVQCCDTSKTSVERSPSAILSLKSKFLPEDKTELSERQASGKLSDSELGGSPRLQADTILALDTCVADPCKNVESDLMNLLEFTAVAETELPAAPLLIENTDCKTKTNDSLSSQAVIIAPDTCVEDNLKSTQDNSPNPLGFTDVPETELPTALSESDGMPQDLESSQGVKDVEEKGLVTDSSKKDDDVLSETGQSQCDSQPISSTYVIVQGRKERATNNLPKVDSEENSSSQDSGTAFLSAMPLESESLSSVMSESLFSGGKEKMLNQQSRIRLLEKCDKDEGSQKADIVNVPQNVDSLIHHDKMFQEEDASLEGAQTLDEGQDLSDFEDTNCVLMVRSGEGKSLNEGKALPVGMEESCDKETLQPYYSSQLEETKERQADFSPSRIILSGVKLKSKSQDIHPNIEQAKDTSKVTKKRGLTSLDKSDSTATSENEADNGYTIIPQQGSLGKPQSEGPNSEIFSDDGSHQQEQKGDALKAQNSGVTKCDRNVDMDGCLLEQENSNMVKESCEDESQSILHIDRIETCVNDEIETPVQSESMLPIETEEPLTKTISPLRQGRLSSLAPKSVPWKRAVLAFNEEDSAASQEVNVVENSTDVNRIPDSLKESSTPSKITEQEQEKIVGVSLQSPGSSARSKALLSENCDISESVKEHSRLLSETSQEVAELNVTPVKDSLRDNDVTPIKKLDLSNSKKKTKRGLATRTNKMSSNPIARHPKGRLSPAAKAALDLEFSSLSKLNESESKDIGHLPPNVKTVEDNQRNVEEVRTISEAKCSIGVETSEQDENNRRKIDFGNGHCNYEPSDDSSAHRNRSVQKDPSNDDTAYEESTEKPNKDVICITDASQNEKVTLPAREADVNQDELLDDSPNAANSDVGLSFDLGISLDDDATELPRSRHSSGISHLDSLQLDKENLKQTPENSLEGFAVVDSELASVIVVAETVEESDLEDSPIDVPKSSSPLEAGNDGSEDFDCQFLTCLDKNDSDNDDSILPSRKRRRLQITSDSEDDGDDSKIEKMDCSQDNATSSSAFSSQSELLTSQQREALEVDVESLQREIAQCEAALQDVHESGPLITPLKSLSLSANTGKSDTEETDDLNGNKKAQSAKRESEDRNEEEDSDDDLFICNSSPSPQRPQPQSAAVHRVPVINKENSGLHSKFLKQFQSPGGSVHKRRTLEFTQSVNNSADTTSDKSNGGKSKQTRSGSPVLLSQQGRRFGKLANKNRDDVSSTKNATDCDSITLVASGLKGHEQEILQKFKSRFCVNFNSKFVPGVTHVIVKSVDGYNFVCERTLKFFFGLAYKAWILNFSWIFKSLEEGRLLKEDEFEIHGDTFSGEFSFGPKKARLSTKPLLAGYSFACIGNCNELPRSDLKSLLVACGANVVEDLIALPLSSAKHKLIVRCNDADEDPSNLEKAMLNSMYQETGVITLSRDWVLDCISSHQIIPVADYQFKI